MKRIATPRDRLLYLASLPERLPRALGAGVGGVLYEGTLVLLPEWTRRTQLYQALLGRLLRISIEWLGGVEEGVRPADPVEADRLMVRKVAGNVVEFTSIFTVGWSPLWMLAAVADLTGGAKVYLHALTDEFKRLQLLPQDQELSSVDGLLESLGGTTSVLAKAIDIPPLARAEVEISLQEMRESWKTLRANLPGLPSPEKMNLISQQMQETASRQGLSLWGLSALLGIGAVQAGLKLGQVHIFEYYRKALADIDKVGRVEYFRCVSRPYLAKAAEHLDPGYTSYIEYAIRRSRRQRAAQVPRLPAGAQ